MFGIEGTWVLGMAIALCGLMPAGLALAEIPGALTAEGARRRGRAVGFLSGHRPVEG